MRFTGEIEGMDEALRKTSALVRIGQMKWRDAVEYVLKELKDYARLHAPYKDRTTHLRNSIDYTMEPPPAPAGTLHDGEKYGIFVERRDGYWVIQGAIDHYRPKLDEIFKGRIQIATPDLDAAAKRATVYYRSLRG